MFTSASGSLSLPVMPFLSGKANLSGRIVKPGARLLTDQELGVWSKVGTFLSVRLVPQSLINICESAANLAGFEENFKSCKLIAAFGNPFHLVDACFLGISKFSSRCSHPHSMPSSSLCLVVYILPLVPGGEDVWSCAAALYFAALLSWGVGFSDRPWHSFCALALWEQEQLSCHSGYTLAQYSGRRTTGSLLWETLRGSSELQSSWDWIRLRWTQVDAWCFNPLLSSGKWFHRGVDLSPTPPKSSDSTSAEGLLNEVCGELSLTPWEPRLELIGHYEEENLFLLKWWAESGTMAGVTRKASGRPSYYYRFLGKSRLQRQRSRSRSRTRSSAMRGNKHLNDTKAALLAWYFPPRPVTEEMQPNTAAAQWLWQSLFSVGFADLWRLQHEAKNWVLLTFFRTDSVARSHENKSFGIFRTSWQRSLHVDVFLVNSLASQFTEGCFLSCVTAPSLLQTCQVLPCLGATPATKFALLQGFRLPNFSHWM